MYGVRNIIIHNYKMANNFQQLIVDITERFEYAIFDVLTKIDISDCDNLSLMVIDKKLDVVSNVEVLKKHFDMMVKL